ncbi:GntP family permease [Limosilactobacillus reuteri]|uniref:GntP family permease n=1 Tax=Limosilactobacillus reuteri TaxID=1598 RepID=UPI0021F065A6|nr:GntP family permease [Limosilactobacillus reuteri]
MSVLGEYKEFKLEETPKFGISVLTAMMPVILIAVATICSFIFPKNNPVNEFIQFIGAPDLAMLLSLIFAIFTMGSTTKPKNGRYFDLTCRLNQANLSYAFDHRWWCLQASSC